MKHDIENVISEFPDPFGIKVLLLLDTDSLLKAKQGQLLLNTKRTKPFPRLVAQLLCIVISIRPYLVTAVLKKSFKAHYRR